MAQLDQSSSHAELIISVCSSIDVLQTVNIPVVLVLLLLQISDTPTFP